ncbi:HTH-type transcriptional regulator BetI [Austwickia sp. TVS 96-490-7B]|uniref:TetR family transcriptional regulator n=1 Tax=Austwickia sp. TVS 96-490-7B TaxID=2830843 RepID=UPI001C57288C|nr:TetR family transcriptional regulator [Austwickia sp. TVS 96-490-7B]MBW3084153.1 HTH-type transcriptional regulator BetI [Austwickia sp. TVS 96-490-7B]
MSSVEDDLTARARIRNAALAEFADSGFSTATVRSIAARAKVSPALVIHHFGSKTALRRSCDEYLLAWFRREHTAVLSGMSLPTRAEYFAARPEFVVLYAYLQRSIHDGGSTADAFFDHFVADITSSLSVGEASGTIRPYGDPHARAVITAAISLGLMLFDTQIARHLGGESILDPAVLDRYTAFTVDLYTHGMLTAPVDFAPETSPEAPAAPPQPPPTPEEP